MMQHTDLSVLTRLLMTFTARALTDTLSTFNQLFLSLRDKLKFNASKPDSRTQRRSAIFLSRTSPPISPLSNSRINSSPMVKLKALKSFPQLMVRPEELSFASSNPTKLLLLVRISMVNSSTRSLSMLLTTSSPRSVRSSKLKLRTELTL